MRTLSRIGLVAAALLAMTVVANADWPRSSARQPDFSSCSSARHACTVGTARRGQSNRWCERAYATCAEGIAEQAGGRLPQTGGGAG